MVVAKARELIGAPYLHQGRTIHGIDCVGVPIWVMQSLGIKRDEVAKANYPRRTRGELVETCASLCTRIDRDELGCLILFRWPGQEFAGHVAIRTDLGIVHSYLNHGGVKEHGFRAKWPQWSDSFWRMPGVVA